VRSKSFFLFSPFSSFEKHSISSLLSPRFVVIPPRPCLFAAAFFLRRALAILAAAEDLKTLPWAIGVSSEREFECFFCYGG